MKHLEFLQEFLRAEIDEMSYEVEDEGLKDGVSYYWLSVVRFNRMVRLRVHNTGAIEVCRYGTNEWEEIKTSSPTIKYFWIALLS